MAKKEISYNEAVSEIEEILQGIESGQADVDTVAESVKRASQLIRLCKEKLRRAESRIEAALSDDLEL